VLAAAGAIQADRVVLSVLDSGSLVCLKNPAVPCDSRSERTLMNEVRRTLLVTLFKLFDLGLVVVAFGIATTLVVAQTRSTSLIGFLSMTVKLWNFAIFVLLLVAWHFIFHLCGMYGSKRLATCQTEAIEAIKASALVAVSLALSARIFTIRIATPTFLIIFWIASSALVGTGRLTVRRLLRMLRRRGRDIHNILIMGTNPRAVAFASRIDSNPELGYRVLGFVDEEWEGMPGFLGSWYPLCCNFENLSEYLRRNVVDEVAMYLPLRSFYERALRVTAMCQQHGILTRFDPDIFDLKTVRPHAEDFDGDAQFAVYSGALEGWPLVVKRILDCTFSFLLLVLLMPLFASVALLIRLTSEGPIFFRQERVGLNKRRFQIYKFRTMVRNAEEIQAQVEALNEVSGPVFKIKNDPRITPIGKFLRRASIDELPQLLNVLKGEMSLVGPRPMAIRDFDGFSEDWQRRRFSIRPGITCLWQVNGRSLIPFQQWMELDMKYIEEWSLWLDLKILAKTIPVVLKGTGAA
jgi:exopolysaccharide biosynthesis polyprenyl glycosylphosphotransferase